MNQCWLVVKANKDTLYAGDRLVDMYVMQDAASMYLFGNVFVPLDSAVASEEDVTQLFHAAWDMKNEWPERLLLADRVSPLSTFADVARRNGIAVQFVPESALSVYIDDVQQAFTEYFGKGAGAA